MSLRVVDAETLQADYGQLLVNGEDAEVGFKVIRSQTGA